VPSVYLLDNVVGVGGPGERLWAAIVLSQVTIDGGLKVDEGMKDAALQSPAGQVGKKPFDSVEPGRRGRGEVERPTRVPDKPSPDFGVLVAAVVVEDHMDQPAGWDVALEAVEKTQEFLVPVALLSHPHAMRL
jgi:hypothetical protein